MSDGEESISPEVPSRVSTPEPPNIDDVVDETGPFRFKIPDSFDHCQENSGSDENFLSKEFQEEHDLWLIRVPKDFDCEKLNQADVALNAQTFFSSGNGKQYEIHSNTENVNDVTLLMPLDKARLKPVKAFKGQMTIVETSPLPQITLPPTPPSTIMELPAGLRQRFKPFGSEPTSIGTITTIPAKDKKKKKKKSKNRIETIEGDKPMVQIKQEIMNAGSEDWHGGSDVLYHEAEDQQKKPKKRKHKDLKHIPMPEEIKRKIKKEKFK